MDERRLFDLSQPLRSGLPGWPGDIPYESAATWRHAADCPVAVSRYTASTHAGTHADAPLHYDPRGQPIDVLPLEPYLGLARLLDLRGRGPVVTPEMIQPLLAQPLPPRILFRTYESFPHDGWRSDYVTVLAGTVSLLAGVGVRLIGIDSPSIDPQDAKILTAHEAARAADLRILEGLVLDDVPAADYELIALPIRLAGLDAAPVRAVLRSLPDTSPGLG